MTRGDEKLNHLRKQVTIRNEDGRSAIDDMQRQVRCSPKNDSLIVFDQVVEAETHRHQLSNRMERVEGEALRVESELTVENAHQEEERGEMLAAYAKLERIVILHLQSLRRALDDGQLRGDIA